MFYENCSENYCFHYLLGQLGHITTSLIPNCNNVIQIVTSILNINIIHQKVVKFQFYYIKQRFRYAVRSIMILNK